MAPVDYTTASNLEEEEETNLANAQVSDLEDSSASDADEPFQRQAKGQKMRVAKAIGSLALLAGVLMFATSSDSGILKAKNLDVSDLSIDQTSGGPIRVNGKTMCIDVQADTNNVQIWNCVPGNNNQQFSLLPSSCDESSGKLARLMWMSNRAAGAGAPANGAKKCLAPAAAGGTSNLQVSNCADSPVFEIPSSRMGQIKNHADQTKCLAVDKSADQGGANVHVIDCLQAGTPLSTWDLSDTPSYVVGVVKVNNKCIKAGSAPKTPAVLETCDESAPQKWIFPEGGRLGLIRSQVDSNLCLDITDANLVAGNGLQVYTCDDGGHMAQLFKIPSVTNTAGGTCSVGFKSSLCLQDSNNALVLGTCTAASAACKPQKDCQLFVVPTTTTTTVTTDAPCTLAAKTIPAREWKIRSRFNNKLVTAENGGTAIETNLGLLDYIPGKAWARFNSKTTGTATTFENVHATGQFINVAAGSTQAGANVQLYNNAASTDSQWNVMACNEFTQPNDGAIMVVLRSAKTGINSIPATYLGVQESNLNVQTSSRPGILASQWILEPATADTTLAAVPVTPFTGATAQPLTLTNVATNQNLQVQQTRRLANVMSGTGVGSDTAEQWKFVKVTAGTATNVVNIENVYSPGQYLSVSGTATGANIELITGNTATSTQWELMQPAGSTYYVLKAKGTDPPLYLGMPHGTNVVANTDYTHTTSQWKLTTVAVMTPLAVTAGDYTFEVVGTTAKYLKPHGNAAGASVYAASSSTGDTKWAIAVVANSGGLNFTIKNVAQNRYISDGGQTTIGANVFVAAAVGTGTTWQFIKQGTTTPTQYSIRSATTGSTFMAVSAASSNAETSSNSTATLFKLNRVQGDLTVSGSVTVNNMNYAALSANAALQTAATTAVQTQVAASAGTAVTASNVAVTAAATTATATSRRLVAAGLTKFTWTITIAAAAKALALQSMTAASGAGGQFGANVQTALQGVTGITAATTTGQTLAVTATVVNQETCGSATCKAGMVCDDVTEPHSPTCKCGATACGATETCDVSTPGTPACKCGVGAGCASPLTCDATAGACKCGTAVCGASETCDGTTNPAAPTCKCGPGAACAASESCTPLFLPPPQVHPNLCMCGGLICEAGETCDTTNAAAPACKCGTATCTATQMCDDSTTPPTCKAAAGPTCGTATCKVGETCDTTNTTSPVCKCGTGTACGAGMACTQTQPFHPMTCTCGGAACNTGETCDTTNAATPVCKCGTAAACTSGQVCNTAASTCAAAPGITCGTATCSAGNACDNSTTPPACKCGAPPNARTCGTSETCTQTNPSYAFSCMCGSITCATGLTCDTSGTAPVCKCGTAVCPAGETCDTTGAAPVCKCGTSATCTSPQVCDTSGLTPVCKCGSAVCDVGETCDDSSSDNPVCKCGTNAACGVGGSCSTTGAAPICTCGSGTPCATGESCDAGVCKCGTSASCNTGETCDTTGAEPVCKCGANPTCGEGETCDTTNANAPACKCGTNPECSPAETCTNGACTCGTTGQTCGVGQTCNAQAGTCS